MMPDFSYIVQPYCPSPFCLYHYFLQGNQNAALLRFKTHWSIHSVIDFVNGYSLVTCCVHQFYFTTDDVHSNLETHQYSDTNDTVTSLVDTVPIYSALNFFPLNFFSGIRHGVNLQDPGGCGPDVLWGQGLGCSEWKHHAAHQKEESAKTGLILYNRRIKHLLEKKLTDLRLACIYSFCSLCPYQAVAKMVQECYQYVDAVTDLTIKLRLIDTLRTVTAGKVWEKK